ncbi:MAG: tRNA1(Val) (adenine(37)-N6)-methyltransferase [Lachnospiraceae bacterium]|nr:tRNA1(Val) (adenine(37)-N6)-methyltransferase [Lachnospiraceae bacterium]
MSEEILREGERLDDLERNGLRLIQHPDVFCFGMDAVLLSHFTEVREGECAIDLGSGNGIIPILLSALSAGTHFTGLEIQTKICDMFERSIRLNHLENRVSAVCGDIRGAAAQFGAASFDVVTSNPPYMIGGHGLTGKNEAKMIARHEILCDLNDILQQTAKLLKPKGRCYFVHRPFRLTEILSGMHVCGIEPKRMRLVYPFVDKEPNMVLIEGMRGGKSRLSIEKPLIVYERQGEYTQEILETYGF